VYFLRKHIFKLTHYKNALLKHRALISTTLACLDACFCTFSYWVFCPSYLWDSHIPHQGTYKVRNEIETKRNETKRNQRKRNETKRNETKSTKTKRNETKSTKRKNRIIFFFYFFISFCLLFLSFHFLHIGLFRVVFVDFVLLSLVSFYFVFFSLISFRFVSFLLISFRFVSFRFVSISFRTL
jgi:magnesium-transporting ATPase (P-type)